MAYVEPPTWIIMRDAKKAFKNLIEHLENCDTCNVYFDDDECETCEPSLCTIGARLAMINRDYKDLINEMDIIEDD